MQQTSVRTGAAGMLIEALSMLGERERTMLWICILLQWVHEVDRLHAPVFLQHKDNAFIFYIDRRKRQLYNKITKDNKI